MLLTLMGQATQFNVALAWIYVAIRIIHSLWQVGVNTIPVRFMLFALSTIVLLLLAVNTVRAAFA